MKKTIQSLAPPRISVITVCLNSVATIERALASVRAQTWPNIEHIVIDGGSTDGTQEIIRHHESSIANWVSEPDHGLYDAMNKGLRLATGRFVHFLNADDQYLGAESISQMAEYLSDDYVAYGQMIYVQPDGTRRTMCHSFSFAEELQGSRVPQPVTFVPLWMYEAVGPFDVSYIVAADYEMLLRLATRFPIRFFDIPVTEMNHGGISDKQASTGFREARDIAVKYSRPAMLAWSDYSMRLLKWRLSRHFPSITKAHRRLIRASTNID